MTDFRSFDEQGNMIRTGRTCTCSRGVVSAGRAEAAEIGRDILARGGNAVDGVVGEIRMPGAVLDDIVGGIRAIRKVEDTFDPAVDHTDDALLPQDVIPDILLGRMGIAPLGGVAGFLHKLSGTGINCHYLL